MDYLASDGSCCKDRCVHDPDSSEHSACMSHVCSWSLSAGLLESDELRHARTYTHRLPCHKRRVSRYSLRLDLWQMTIKLTTLFSDSVPCPQTQLHFGRKSGLTEVKHRHSSLLTVLRNRDNNASTTYCVVLLDPKGHMESPVHFLDCICWKISTVKTRTNSSTCATLCVPLGQARYALKTKTGCVCSFRKKASQQNGFLFKVGFPKVSFLPNHYILVF